MIALGSGCHVSKQPFNEPVQSDHVDQQKSELEQVPLDAHENVWLFSQTLTSVARRTDPF